MLEKINKISYRHKSLILYGISLFTPIFYGSSFLGIHALILGWMGVFAMEPFIALPYFANLLFFGNLLFFKNNLKISIPVSLITIALALFSIGIREVPVDEGGGYDEVFVGIDFFLWLFSFVVLLIGQLNERKAIKLN